MEVQFWSALITTTLIGVGVIIVQVANLILNYMRDQAAIEREHQRELARLERAKEAKATLAQIAEKVEEVAKATNGKSHPTDH